MFIIVVVAGARQMIQLMAYIECTCRRVPAALHGKAMQGQDEHQEKAKKAAHRESCLMKLRQIISIWFRPPVLKAGRKREMPGSEGVVPTARNCLWLVTPETFCLAKNIWQFHCHFQNKR
jgi:hypothetical protein